MKNHRLSSRIKGSVGEQSELTSSSPSVSDMNAWAFVSSDLKLRLADDFVCNHSLLADASGFPESVLLGVAIMTLVLGCSGCIVSLSHCRSRTSRA